MATFILDPIGDDNTLWGTYDFNNIDDGIREPTASGFTGGGCTAGSLDDNEEQIWTMGTAPASGVLTAVTQWVRWSANADALDIEGNLYVAGASQGLTTYATTPLANTWDSVSWSGLNIGLTSGSTAFKTSLKVGAIGSGETGPTAEEVYLLLVYSASGVDTAAKRFSMMNWGDGTFIHAGLVPDGTIAAPDRSHFLDCYSGIAWDAPVSGGVIAGPLVNGVPLKSKLRGLVN